MPALGGKHFIQAYNAQAAVDSAHQVIVAAEVINKPADRGQAEPMMDIVKANTGKLPRQMSADAGYFLGDAANNLTAQGIDVYMPPDKMGHRLILPPVPRGRIPKKLSVADRMRRKLRTKKRKERYSLRKELPEPVFGQIKQARGFGQFLLRGKDRTDAEWKMICVAHNLLKLFGARRNGAVRGRLRPSCRHNRLSVPQSSRHFPTHTAETLSPISRRIPFHRDRRLYISYSDILLARNTGEDNQRFMV